MTGIGADVFHYAGHGVGDWDTNSNKLLLSDTYGDYVSALDILAGHGEWSSTVLAFLSACEAAAGSAQSTFRSRSISVAESLLI